MLDIAAQLIVDRNQLAINRRGKRVEHRNLIRMEISRWWLEVKHVLRWDFNRVLVLNFSFCGTAWGFQGGNVSRGRCDPPTTVFASVLSVQFELESTDSLIAFRIVTNDPDLCTFADVVLVALKNNFGDAFGCTEPEEAADLVFKSKP